MVMGNNRLLDRTKIAVLSDHPREDEAGGFGNIWLVITFLPCVGFGFELGGVQDIIKC
jgi:hypothetical protein